MIAGATPWPPADVARFVAAGHWRADTLDGLLTGWARRWPDRTAVVAGEHRLSYRDLDGAASAAAAGLRALGLARGDRVLVQLPNAVEFPVVLFGSLRAGLVPVLALPAHRRVEIGHLVDLARARAYVIPARHEGFDHRDLAAEVLADAPGLRHVLVAGDPGPHTALADVLTGTVPGHLGGNDPADVALLLVSGGTTGRPKLIPRTHRDYAYNARASAEVCELTERDVMLLCLPAAHNFPLACPGLLGTLGVGGTTVLAPAASPDAAFELVEREAVTVTALVPPLARVWGEAAEWDGRDLSSLRLLQVGGAKLDAASAAALGPSLRCRVQQVFGMAEGLLNFTRAEDPDELVTGTQGRPLSPDDEVRIVDPDGADVPTGGTGELLTRGPYTLRGYYRQPEHNATVFTPDGFFRTGDLVRALPSGHLVVEGRVKDVINRGGENVSAADLEEHLLGHPAVAQAAVVGLPDPTMGERVCAVLVLRAGAQAPTLPTLKAFLTGRGLARFMLPDRVALVDTLPVTAVGKIAKNRLTRTLTEGTR